MHAFEHEVRDGLRLGAKVWVGERSGLKRAANAHGTSYERSTARRIALTAVSHRT